jgi:XTP/dITP diphosphohydrolase
MKLIRCASTNAGKLREFRSAAIEFGFPNVDIKPLEFLYTLPECVEDGLTFEENAVKKAIHYSVHTHRPVFADDSGLVVDALGGAPGIHSARFAGPKASDADNNRLLLDKLGAAKERSARFVCVVALAHDGRLLATFQGAVEGAITLAPAGNGGFGYDPLFFYPPFGCTLAEVDPSRKMAVSHRGQALKQMLSYVASNL